MLLIAAACIQLAQNQAVADSERPNILYFYVDDMGWGSIGPNGQAERKAAGLPYVRTPNINQLAADGINFRRGYACHVCSPSRASQQSGFHQGHAYADRNDPNNARKAMRADDVLIGDALSAAGYVTGYWGKWGYGGSKDHDSPVIDNVQTLPTSHGYQHVLAELHHVRAHTFFQPTLWKAPAASNAIGGVELVPNSMRKYRGAGYPTTPALQSHRDYPRTGYCDDAYAFAALDFVREQSKNYRTTGKPFFGLLAAQIPHAPFGEIAKLPEWNAAYADDSHFSSLDKQTQQWVAMVTRIDAHIGNILSALDDPNGDGDTSDSVANDTLVIFQSDNGGPAGKNNIELDANGGLRGTKGKIQEGGIRVPLVMRWPRMITKDSTLRAGTNSEQVVDITDLLPTFCDLAGTTTPLGIDGVSIAPTLTGNGVQRQREFVIHEAGNGQSIIRGRYKLVRGSKSDVQLYDLEDDPSESHNIVAKHPQLVKKLTTLLIGERVTEPKGFANTYHNWTGDNGSRASDADNWSDYEYSNAGITYQTDSGAPQLSWVAKMQNSGTAPNTAVADQDLEFLALEIHGTSDGAGSQALMLERGINLTGRNEIRIGNNGHLSFHDGTVSSLRWIDIADGGSLLGTGRVKGAVYNNGLFRAIGPEDSRVSIEGTYRQSGAGTLEVEFRAERKPSVEVTDAAFIGGSLRVFANGKSKLQSGQQCTILTAGQVAGKFSSVETVSGGRDLSFSVRYSDDSITLTVD